MPYWHLSSIIVVGIVVEICLGIVEIIVVIMGTVVMIVVGTFS
jgi:hypothetical protein